MRPFHLVLAGAALAAACNQPPTTTATAATTETSVVTQQIAAATPAPWVLCDGIDAAKIFLFSGDPSGASTTLTIYDKSKRAATASAPVTYQVGEGDGAAGSVFTPFLQNGQPAGNVRQVNAGNFETPGAAYTTPYTSVTIGEDEHYMCRWMPRTRLIGFSDRRSFVISEDKDGDLIYTTYDFGNPYPAPIDVSDNGTSTTFSLEVRGGEEHVGPNGAQFVFNNNGYRYVVDAANGVGEVAVFHGGAQPMQTERLIAYVLGDAAQANQH